MKIECKLLTRHLMSGVLTVMSVLASPADTVRAAQLAVSQPEVVGFSSQRIRRLEAAMQRMVDEQEFAGIVTLAARHGKVFHSKVYGLRDKASGAPMPQDAIFRIYSMSKPIIGVAMMILYEEGKWSPQDPISKHIPEFAGLKVFKELDATGKMSVEDPVHAPTMRELMSHTAGFSYGAGEGPVENLYHDTEGHSSLLGAPSLQVMIDRLAGIPLLYQPGTRWVYSVSVDIQGYLVQKLSGMPLAQFLKERIFDPLGMTDTDFFVPPNKWGRFAHLYQRTVGRELIESPQITVGYDRQPALPSGGAGLVSTAGDYLRFAQMLLNGGELNGTRILAQRTVELMAANHLAESLMSGEWGGGVDRMRPGLGFGFDVAVYTNPALADEPCGRGTYRWDGAAGTWFWIDPTNDLVFVGMAQQAYRADRPNLGEIARQATYQALVDLNK